MKIAPFKLERYFAKHEFSAQYLLSSSDCDGFRMNDILSMANIEELKLWQELQLGYTESQGLPLLRNEITKLYSDITSDEVMVLTPEEGIFIALNSILSKDDHVICIAPSYQSLHQVVRSIGCDITFWFPDEERGWYFDPHEMEKVVRPNTRLIIINFPHNPTGYLPSLQDFKKIIDIARSRNLILFSDEMYRYLEHDASLRLPSASDLYPNAISLSGLSKTFGLAGLRIGWLATQNRELLQEMLAFKDYTTICCSAPSEVLGLIGLRHKESLVEINLKKIKRNLGLLDGFIQRHPSLLSWNKPNAGTVGLAMLNIGIPSYEFCERIVKDAGIMIVPSEVFDYGDKHIRLGFGRVNLPEGLDRLDKILGESGW
jgi:aspartate/methionine/tyrosine aminotransferase